MYVPAPLALHAGPLAPTGAVLAAAAAGGQVPGQAPGEALREVSGIALPLAAGVAQSLVVQAAQPQPTGAAQAAAAGAAGPGTAGPGSAGPGAAAAAVADTAISVRRENLNVLAGQTMTIAGALLHGAGPVSRHSPGLAGATVLLQVRGRRGRWHTLAGTRTGARGRYRLRYVPRRIGSAFLRMRFAGRTGEHGSHRLLGMLSVFREVDASWYGGEGSLACGGWLNSSTLGVANKTLPCGTLVTLRYGGHDLRVPVIDRGPFVAGREYDLTEATKRALGFEGVGEVWATA
jgi:rare lipoprotein A